MVFDKEQRKHVNLGENWGLASRQVGDETLLYGTDGSDQIFEFFPDNLQEKRRI